ncbi:MAG TPA: hypothetical protein VFI99_06485 [Nocardioides sp.]|jgi:hypothetical protein|nr:hypothetical protein [Nocardioides sp.]
MRRWVRRATGAAALVVVLDIVLSVFAFAPDHVRLALLVTLGVAVTGLLSDSVGESGPVWRVEPMSRGGATATDPHLASYVRILESHLTARTADTALRNRLATLCDERLSRRHGLTRNDPAAEELLGPGLLRELAGPPRRLRREEIDGYLRRIEQL